MPELPEVETIRRQLKEVLVGRKIRKIEVLNEKSFLGDSKEILELKINDVLRKSKVVEIALENNLCVLIHLKMTGQLIFLEGNKRIVGGHPTADWVNELPSKHTRVILTFDDGSKLFFNDLRKFGWVKIAKFDRLDKNIIPDVVDEGFTLEYFRRVLKKSKRAIKLTILDQGLIGGVGNIYANDALYLAKVMPNRPSNSLSEIEIKRLREAIIEVINLGIEYGGASAANYVDTKGMGGTYQNHFLVYKQDGKICKKCGEKILKIKLGGRGTFYCPNCQR